MNYLKKYISFNLFAFYGYFVLSRFILYWKNYNTQLFYLGLLQNCAESILISFIFPILFLCEFIILFILSKIFKKKLGLNIQNKVYDVLFRLGFMSAFIPIIMIISFSFCLLLGFLLPPYRECNLISVIAYFVGVFDILIRCIFLRKYFVKNS